MSGLISGLGAVGGIVGFFNKLIDFITPIYYQLKVMANQRQTQADRERLDEIQKIKDPRERARALRDFFRK